MECSKTKESWQFQKQINHIGVNYYSKNISSFKYLLLYALVYVLFVLGYLLSKKYKIKSNIMDDYYKESVNEKTAANGV